MKDNITATQAQQQRTVTNFVSPISPTHATNQSMVGYTNGFLTRTLQRGYSKLGNNNLSCMEALT